MQDEAAAIFQRIAAADSGNQNLLRCRSVLGLSRGMALRHPGRGDEARPLLLAAVQALPVKPPPAQEPPARCTACVARDRVAATAAP